MKTTVPHWLSFIILIIIFSVSCKKTDIFQETEPSVNSNINTLEDKFFNTHRTNNTKENALVNFIKRRNEKEHFV